MGAGDLADEAYDAAASMAPKKRAAVDALWASLHTAAGGAGGSRANSGFPAAGRETLAALNMPDEIVMRHRSPHFSHVFSGEGYATGYYGYMWADVLTSDAAEAFEEAPGGFYDRDLARKLVDHLFAVCNSVDPAEAYRAFRGRDARMEALMRDRGFPVPGE